MKNLQLSLFLMLICTFIYGGAYSQVPNNSSALKLKLERLFDEDQKIRVTLDSLINLHGYESAQVQSYIKETMMDIDSVNTAEVIKILETYGWLGTEKVGMKGNAALFVIIQHGSLKTQETYLPMLRHSVKQGKSSPINLGMLEDRIALSKHKRQVYGTQLWTKEDGSLFIAPVSNPDKLDKRRKSIGLEPISTYAKAHGFDWNLENYKKEIVKYVKML
jgi:hypothetical protein